MKTSFAIAGLVFVLMSCQSKHKPDKDRERINKVCDKIMEDFKGQRVDDVVAALRSNSYLITKESIDTLEQQIITQFESGVMANYGKVVSFELIKDIKAGNVAAKRIYALKFEHFFLTFTFTLYRAPNGWEITGFKYDEESAVLF